MKNYIILGICSILGFMTIYDTISNTRQLKEIDGRIHAIEVTLYGEQSYDLYKDIVSLRNEINKLRNEFQNNEMEQSAAFSKAIKELKDK